MKDGHGSPLHEHDDLITGFVIRIMNDWYSREDVWVNEQKDFIARIKSIYNSI